MLSFFNYSDCFAEQLVLLWPKTKGGQTAVSTEVCPEYSTKGMPIVSRAFSFYLDTGNIHLYVTKMIRK